jgi:hypothetical protein
MGGRGVAQAWASSPGTARLPPNGSLLLEQNAGSRQFLDPGPIQLVFATVLISRINSWESWLFLTCEENKQVSHAPGT